jgi:N-methylhydantoinase B
VLEDVIDGYVSVERAERDYGVVIQVNDPDIDDYEINAERTAKAREWIRTNRREWLQTPPEDVAKQYRDGELNVLDVIRRYGVVLDWGTGELLEKSTRQYRDSLDKRSSSFWT